jgi:hypothetical protein
MNYILAQLILAARKSNEDKGWVQIFVFVILAVFYVLGSILKVKADKGAAKKKQIPGKPLRRPPESTIDLKMLKQLFGLPEEPKSETQPQTTKPQAQPTHRKVVRPQTAVRKPTIKTEEAVKIHTFEPQVQPKLEKVPGLTGTMPQVEAAAQLVSAEQRAAGAEIPQTIYLPEILSDYEDLEKLRRAILHYEILGKPISLREQERAF